MCVGVEVATVLSRKSHMQGSRNSTVQDPDAGEIVKGCSQNLSELTGKSAGNSPQLAELL